MAEEEIQFNAEELTLLYRVARTLLYEREYGELLAGLLDATIEGRVCCAFRAAPAFNRRKLCSAGSAL